MIPFFHMAIRQPARLTRRRRLLLEMLVDNLLDHLGFTALQRDMIKLIFCTTCP